jgi:hypothetical protein
VTNPDTGAAPTETPPENTYDDGYNRFLYFDGKKLNSIRIGLK